MSDRVSQGELSVDTRVRAKEFGDTVASYAADAGYEQQIHY